MITQDEPHTHTHTYYSRVLGFHSIYKEKKLISRNDERKEGGWDGREGEGGEGQAGFLIKHIYGKIPIA